MTSLVCHTDKVRIFRGPFEHLVNSYSEHLHMSPRQNLIYVIIRWFESRKPPSLKLVSAQFSEVGF
jgi:hypothetical protein